MFKKLLQLLLLVSSIASIFSIDSGNIKIANDLFQSYGNDISLEQVNKVLDFDNTNRDALIKKAIFMDTPKNSLFLAKETLEKSEMITIESKLHYISILYRLKLYTELIDFSDSIDFETVSNSDSFYYLADSYIRTDLIKKAETILSISTHQFPLDQRFLELLYLLDSDRKILSKIEVGNNPLQSYLRLYSRVNEKLSIIILEILISRELNSIDINDTSTYLSNYEVLPVIFKSLSKEKFSGLYSFDTDSDTFPDTYFKVLNGVIQYRGIDRNCDNIIDYEIFLKNGLPQAIVLDGNILAYEEYPFIDYISIVKENRITYNLYKNHTEYKLGNLTKRPDFTQLISQVTKFKLISKEIYSENNISSRWIYRSDNSILIYSQPNILGKFDSCVLMKDETVITGLRDLNSDGLYDLNDIYIDGVLVGSGYSSTGKNADISYIENYTKEDIDIKSKINFNWWQE